MDSLPVTETSRSQWRGLYTCTKGHIWSIFNSLKMDSLPVTGFLETIFTIFLNIIAYFHVTFGHCLLWFGVRYVVLKSFYWQMGFCISMSGVLFHIWEEGCGEFEFVAGLASGWQALPQSYWTFILAVLYLLSRFTRAHAIVFLLLQLALCIEGTIPILWLVTLEVDRYVWQGLVCPASRR